MLKTIEANSVKSTIFFISNIENSRKKNGFLSIRLVKRNPLS